MNNGVAIQRDYYERTAATYDACHLSTKINASPPDGAC
jgi:hypothetical protein